MQKSVTRKFLKIISIVLLFVIVALSVGTYFLIKNKDGITSIVIEQLNEHLITPIHHDEITLSLFKKIPYIAVEFKNVWAESPYFDDHNDTLFSVKSAYVMLNIFKALGGNYSINKLELNTGTLNLYVNAYGKANYQIWKSSNTKSGKSYTVDLQDISFKNVRLTYYNVPNNFKAAARIQHLNINGAFNQDEALINLKSNVYINYLSRGDIRYIRDGNTHLNVSILKKGDVLRYKDGWMKVNRQQIETNGFFNTQSGEMDVALNARSIKFDSDQNVFNLNESLTSFARITGNLYALARITGNTKYQKDLNIISNFNLSSGTLLLKGQKLRYRIHYVKGEFKSYQKTRYDIFELDSIAITGNGDTIQGAVKISNFGNPQLAIRAKASLNCKNLNAFITNSNDIAFNNGRIALNWYTGNINLSREDLWQHFIEQSKNTSIQLIENQLTFAGIQKEISRLDALLYLNNSLLINDLYIEMPDADGRMKGNISNLFNLVSKKSTWIDLKGESKKAAILKLIASPAQATGNKEGLQLPSHVYLKYESRIETLMLDEVAYSNIHADLHYKAGLISLKIFEGEFFKGHVKGNCALAMPVDEALKFAFIAEISDADITSMFQAYDEFGQDFITSRNLKGKMSANINFKSNLMPDYSFDTKTIVANASIQIKNGELMDHEPMYSLSKYIKLDELKHIYFADLKNEVYIQNECITIPDMQITSSALDIEMSGKHYFDNHYEYQMTLYVSDLLAKKVKRTKENEDSFTYTERSNAKHFKIPLIMRGDDVNFEVEMNRRQARENFSASVKQEKEEIKNVLRQEFKIFNRDSLPGEKVMNNTGLKIEFEDGNETKKTDTGKDTRQTEKTKLKFEFEE